MDRWVVDGGRAADGYGKRRAWLMTAPQQQQQQLWSRVSFSESPPPPPPLFSPVAGLH